jgi:hypothetical protein
VENKLQLTGVFIGYNNTEIHDYYNLNAREVCKKYFESDDITTISLIDLWYELDDGETFFFTIKPDQTQDKWIAYYKNELFFSFIHKKEQNLLDQIENEIKLKGNFFIS